MSNAISSLVPRHVGLIPDGGRRWAKLNQKSLLESYTVMMQVISSFTRFMFQNQVDSVSLYLLSKENLRRSEHEFTPGLEAEITFFKHLLPDLVDEYQAQVIHAGSIGLLPGEYATALGRLCNYSSQYSSKKLYVLAAYNPFDELNFALSKSKTNTITVHDLWVTEPLDLVFRTSGEHRISSFLPLQSTYAELVFVDKLLNDITQKEMSFALEIYKSRSRRFGV